MSKTEKIYRFGIDVEATTSQAQKDLASLGEILKSLKLPDSTKKSFGELFETANSNLETFIALSSKTTHTEKDVKDLGKAYNNVSNAIAMMSTKLAGIEAMDLKSLLPKDLQKQLKEVRGELQSLQDLAKGDNSEQIQNQTAKVEKQKETVDKLTKSVQELNTTLAEGGEQWNKQNSATENAKKLKEQYDSALAEQKRFQKNNKQIMTEDEYNSSVAKVASYQKRKKEANKKVSDLEEQAKNLQTEIDDKTDKIKNKYKGRDNAKTQGLQYDVDQQNKKLTDVKKKLANEKRSRTMIEKSEDELGENGTEQKKQNAYIKNQEKVAKVQQTGAAYEKAAEAAQKVNKETEEYAQKASERQSKLETEKKTLESLEKTLEEIKTAASSPQGLENLRKALAQIRGVDISEIPENLDEIERYIDGIEGEKLQELAAGMAKFRETTDQAGNTVVKTMGKGTEEINKQKDSVDSLDAQVKSLQSSFLNFFSLTNGWSLLQRAIKNAYATVKELDASMTEIAVVSEYTIDDIWAMRGKYSDAATEMGAKTIDLVDATKLLVQQGLSLNQSLETGIEVTKMARIANLSGADATNLMTAQLRGFNMEMSEANRVSDVFSNLAAKTQADTEEIAVALSKTASIANSAGASFENTSAFLTQIVNFGDLIQ